MEQTPAPSQSYPSTSEPDPAGTPLEAARDLLERLGVVPVPVPFKSKNPNRQGWEQERVTLEELPGRFNGAPGNVGGLWGEPSGGAVDVDLDCPQVKITARRFLPETGAVYGHAGNPRSHALYRCLDGTTPARTRRWKDVDGATLIELRSTGAHSLAPGSTHPDGHLYQWAEAGEPGAVDGRELGRLVARSAAAALLARHWPAEGGRHDAAGALAGGLLRLGWADADVLAFVGAVLVASGDDEADDHYRYAADTLGNAHAGRQVTGWPTLAQAVPDAVVTRVRQWLGAPVAAGAAAPAPTAPDAPATTLAGLLATFKRWLHLPDDGAVLAVLAAIVANLLPGDPAWLMLIAGSGWGKTEILQACRQLPYAYVAATLTEPALLSGTSKRERDAHAKGGLLREIGDFGLLMLKDFTSVLSMHREQRGQVLAALREIYDGSWTRYLGVDGGKALSWEGKLGLIAGCTPTIDGHHAVIGAMGERFVAYRLRAEEDEALARQAVAHAGQEAAMRRELSAAVAGLFAGLAVPEVFPAPGAAAQARIIDLAVLVCRCRSAVERDARSREVELIPDREAPSRLALVLTRLFVGLRLLGVDAPRAWDVLKRIGMDSMPALRRQVLEGLAGRADALSTSQVATTVGYPTQTTRRALEDLAAHGVLERLPGGEGLPDRWRPTAFAAGLHARLEETFPEMSDVLWSPSLSL